MSARIASRKTTGWKRPFDKPIPLPPSRQLVTLEDAGNYITKFPKAEHEAAKWQAAMEALILVATLGGPTRLGMSAISLPSGVTRHGADGSIRSRASAALSEGRSLYGRMRFNVIKSASRPDFNREPDLKPGRLVRKSTCVSG
jgi:hypothetical protein